MIFMAQNFFNSHNLVLFLKLFFSHLKHLKKDCELLSFSLDTSQRNYLLISKNKRATICIVLD